MLEKDFEVLRKPLQSGRQGLASIGGILILSIFMQALLFFLVHVVIADYSHYPHKEVLYKAHLIFTVSLMILSVIFSLKGVFIRFQKTQYLLSILVSQNMGGLMMYLYFLFYIGRTDISERNLVFITYATIILGVLVFIFTFLRFIKLLKKGRYRAGSDKEKLRAQFEGKVDIGLATVIGTGLSFIVIYLFRKASPGLDDLFITLLLLSIVYTMVFVLPEQLVILYCKCRFSSFNFDRRGGLYPIGFDEKYGKKNKARKA